MSAEDLAHIFERFYRAGGGDPLAGSGLGLWGAKAIIEQHGGTLSIESKEASGTIVTIRLPLSSQQTETH